MAAPKSVLTQLPRRAVADLQPCLITCAADELEALGIPFHLLAVVIREIDEMADDDGVSADLDVANWEVAGANAGEPIRFVVVALVEPLAIPRQVFSSHCITLRLRFSFLLGAKPELELAAIDVNLSL